MENVKVLEGQQVIQFEGVTNLDQLLKIYTKFAEQYKGLVVVEGEEKAYKEMVEELKKERTPLKNVRTAMNKQLKELSKIELEKMDKVIAVLDEVIKPIENGLEVLADEKRQIKIKKKQDKFMPLLDELNQIISDIDLPYFELEQVGWQESWNNKKDSDIDMEITKLTEEIKTKIKTSKNARATAELIADKFKNEYDLKVKIDIEVLKGDIYLDVAELTEKIDELALKQQELELAVEEKVIEEVEHKQEKKEVKKVVVTDVNIEEKTKTIILKFPDLEKSKAMMLMEFLTDNGITYIKE